MRKNYAKHCNSMQFTAIHCNSLQFTAKRCNSGLILPTSRMTNKLPITAKFDTRSPIHERNDPLGFTFICDCPAVSADMGIREKSYGSLFTLYIPSAKFAPVSVQMIKTDRV